MHAELQHLGLLVPVALIAFRAWEAFATAAIVMLLLPLPSLLLGGGDVWLAWLHQMPAIAKSLAQGVDGPHPRLVSASAAFVAAGVPLYLAEFIQIVLSLTIAAIAYVACRRRGFSELAVAMLGVGTLIVTPYAWHYDLLIATFAAVVMTEAGIRSGFQRWEVLSIILVWLLPVFAISALSVPAVFVAVLLLQFALLVRRMSRTPVDAVVPAGIGNAPPSPNTLPVTAAVIP